jgi:hypothetical protein
MHQVQYFLEAYGEKVRWGGTAIAWAAFIITGIKRVVRSSGLGYDQRHSIQYNPSIEPPTHGPCHVLAYIM